MVDVSNRADVHVGLASLKSLVGIVACHIDREAEGEGTAEGRCLDS
jgi:hypothetical protein